MRNLLSHRFNFISVPTALSASLALSGCSATHHAGDPWYGWNRGAYTFNQDADRFVLKPVAEAYEWITPEFIDDGLTNVFENVRDVKVFINDFLQLKMAQGGMDLSRFLINSTMGVGGMFDVATQFDMPKHNEDFGQTLAVWGVESGPYLVLPFMGPSSPRDLAGRVGDAFFNPLTYVAFIGSAASIATTGSSAADIIDTRSDEMSSENIIEEATSTSVNSKYDFIKSAYQQRREYLANDGHTEEDTLEFEDEFDESSSGGDPKTASPANVDPTPSSHKLNLSAPEPYQ